jgi:hypothetical protein
MLISLLFTGTTVSQTACQKLKVLALDNAVLTSIYCDCNLGIFDGS